MSCCNRATEFGTIDKIEHEEAASLEEVVVTGSYLYTGADTPSPVSVISGEDMVGFAPPDLQSFFFDNDRLTLRGSWGNSFKGPTVSHTAAETIFTGMGPARTNVDGTTYGARGAGVGLFTSHDRTRPWSRRPRIT